MNADVIDNLKNLDSNQASFLAEGTLTAAARESDTLEPTCIKPVWVETKRILRDMESKDRTNRVLREWLRLTQ